MTEYVFTVRDRQTGEILCQGERGKCANYIGCTDRYIMDLATKNWEYRTETKYSKYKVEVQVFGEATHGGRRNKDIVCCDCGVLLENAIAHRKRCPACARKYTLEQNREQMRTWRATGSVAQPYIKKAPNSHCEGCVYFRGLFEINRCCNYYFDTGERRPCPPWDSCTVKKERKRREKKKRSADIS